MTAFAGADPAIPGTETAAAGRAVTLSRWWRSLPALAIPAVGTAALSVLLSHLLPLTHDEASNWVHFSRFGPHHIVTDYARPNNHVLFTLIQGALPAGWVQSHPLLLRLPNVIYASALMTFMARWLQRLGVPVWLATLGLLAGGPLTVLYLGVARGYLLGTLLLFAGLHLLTDARRPLWRIVLAGLLTALSLWTLPTFAFGLPGVGLVLLLRRRWRDLLVWGATAVVVAVLLYLPILSTMLSQTNSHGNALGVGGYTAGVLQHALWLTAWAPGWLSDLLWAIAVVAAAGLAGRSAWRRRPDTAGRAADPDPMRELLTILVAYSVCSLLVVEVGNASGVMHAPYFRNALFVGYVAVLLLLAATARAGWLRWIAALIVAADIVAAGVGIGLLVHADDYSIGLYDNVLVAAPPPALRHLHAPTVTAVHCDWRDIVVCTVYRRYLQRRGVAVAYQQVTTPGLPCVVGSVTPMRGHSVIAFRGPRRLGQLCQDN